MNISLNDCETYQKNTRADTTVLPMLSLTKSAVAVRASFACEGIQFTAEDEALFEQLDRNG